MAILCTWKMSNDYFDVVFHLIVEKDGMHSIG